MATSPLLPEIHVGMVDPCEPELPLVSTDVLRYVWHSRFGDMLVEVRDGLAFVNGQPVEPAGSPSRIDEGRDASEPVG